MELWWLLLITISIASGDLHNYHFYEPVDEGIIKNGKDNYPTPEIQKISSYPEVDLERKRSFREEDQGKRQQRFHAWGGKRYEGHLEDEDLEENINDMEGQEEHYLTSDNSSLSALDYESDDNGSGPKEKRASNHPAFSSWGGKRDFEESNRHEKRSNYIPVLQLGELKTKMVDQNRKRYPAFNSWAGKRSVKLDYWGEKRAPAFNSWAGKRGAAFNSWGGKRNAAFNSWGGKRNAAFNSWGGKRNAAFNSWGGKRNAAFNSWGGKRNAAFNSWGGKRDPGFNFWEEKRPAAFNSWGGKRGAAFNSWGGKRAAAFNSWGGKRAAAFNSWGGKRAAAFNSWGGKRAAAFNSWGGKRLSDFNNWRGKSGWSVKSEPQMFSLGLNEEIARQEEQNFPDFNCNIFQPLCDDICEGFKNDKKESFPNYKELRSLYEIDNLCRICYCPSHKQQENIQLTLNMGGEDGNVSPLSARTNDAIRNLLLHQVNKNKEYPEKALNGQVKVNTELNTFLDLSHLLEYVGLHQNQGNKYNIQTRFLEPKVNINFLSCEEEYKNPEKYKTRYCQELLFNDKPQWNIPKETVKNSKNEKELERNRGLPFDGNNKNIGDEIGNGVQQSYEGDISKELSFGNTPKYFEAVFDSNYKNKMFPADFEDFSRNTNKYHFQNSDIEDRKFNTNYFSETQYENSRESPMKYNTYMHDNSKATKWIDKRSPIFHTWYENKVPKMQLTNGKRRPAFSSWGGKRSDITVFQTDPEECIKENGDCVVRKRNRTNDAESTTYAKHLIMAKNSDEQVEPNNKGYSIGGSIYGTSNRDKRSTNNMKKNRDITKLILQGGFSWPLMVKSFSKGVNFYAWGGKRSL